VQTEKKEKETKETNQSINQSINDGNLRLFLGGRVFTAQVQMAWGLMFSSCWGVKN
jgi:hypothetical protein